MLATPVLFALAPGDTARVELRQHNPFASRNIITSAAILPTQGQADCDAEVDSPRATGSLLKGWVRRTAQFNYLARGIAHERTTTGDDKRRSGWREEPQSEFAKQLRDPLIYRHISGPYFHWYSIARNNVISNCMLKTSLARINLLNIFLHSDSIYMRIPYAATFIIHNTLYYVVSVLKLFHEEHSLAMYY